MNSTINTDTIHTIKGNAPAQQPTLVIDKKGVVKVLVAIVFFLLVGHIIAYYAGRVTSNETVIRVLHNLFNLSGEGNFPTYFTSLLLISAAVLLYLVYYATKAGQGAYKQHWFMLSTLFLYLSIDESTQLHERLGVFFSHLLGANASGFLTLTWVVPYSVLALAAAIYFFKFVLALPAKTRTLFFVSGFVYVGSALGFEFIEGFVVGNNGYNYTYWVLSTIEEVLEMCGVIIFIYALLDYMQKYTRLMPNVI